MDSSGPLRLVNPSGLNQPVVQVLPFSVNAVGFGLLPLQLPLKPLCADCPGARDPFQDKFVADRLQRQLDRYQREPDGLQSQRHAVRRGVIPAAIWWQ